MSLQMVTVTGTLKHLDGTPQVGRVEFALPYTLVDTTGHVLWSDSSVPAELDNGAFSVQLPATDSAGVSPTNWTYTVTIATDGNSDAPFQCLLPASPSSVHLDQLVRVDVPPTVGAWVPVSALGVTVATLGDDGLVPVDQLPAGSGGGVATVGAANGTIAVTGTATNPLIGIGTGLPESAITGLTTDLSTLSSGVGSASSTATAAGSAAAAAQSTANSAATTAAAAYVKPGPGIPKTDLASAVQTSLGLADTALQSAPVTSVATRTGAVTLTKADVGLSSVDNTSDTGKPVSTAQAAAIAAKYTLPGGGIPKTDLVSSVQTSLGKADTALQVAPAPEDAIRYGCHSRNVPLHAVTKKSTINNEAWFARILVRANTPIVSMSVFRTALAAVLGAGGLNSMALYADAGGAPIASSATDDSMWLPTATQITKALAGVPTPTIDTWYLAGVSARGYSTPAEFAFADVVDAGGLSDIGGLSRYKGGGFTSWPTSLNPASDLTTGGGFVLPIYLG